jgi:hypothetical protein
MDDCPFDAHLFGEFPSLVTLRWEYECWLHIGSISRQGVSLFLSFVDRL